MKVFAWFAGALSAVSISFASAGCSDDAKPAQTSESHAAVGPDASAREPSDRAADTAAQAGQTASDPVPDAAANAGARDDGDGSVNHAAPPSIEPTNDPNTVLVRMDAFDVAPGQEVFKCQDFDNPFGGEDVAIGRSESDMTPGSHHLHVYYGADTSGRRIADCQDPNEFRPMVHLATVPHQISEYPAGMAAKLKGGAGLRMQAHYFNTTDDPLHTSVTVKLTKVDPSSVDQWVGQMHFNRLTLTIPPNQTTAISTTCTIPANFGTIGLVTGVSHMHRHGVHFNAQTTTGIELVDTDQWDEAPPVDYPEPIMLNPGDGIKWTCTFNNTTAQTITYGDSAIKNEMCIYIARFVSSPSGDDLECETIFPSFAAQATKNVAGM